MFSDVMTSSRDVIPSCKYDDNNQVEFSHKPNHRNGNGISSRALLLADMKAVRFLTSCSNFNDVIASRYDMKTSCKYTHDNNLEPGNRNIYRNTCASSLLNIDKLIYKKSEFPDMTSRHDVIASCKHKNVKIFRPSRH